MALPSRVPLAPSLPLGFLEVSLESELQVDSVNVAATVDAYVYDSCDRVKGQKNLFSVDSELYKHSSFRGASSLSGASSTFPFTITLPACPSTAPLVSLQRFQNGEIVFCLRVTLLDRSDQVVYVQRQILSLSPLQSERSLRELARCYNTEPAVTHSFPVGGCGCCGASSEKRFTVTVSQLPAVWNFSQNVELLVETKAVGSLKRSIDRLDFEMRMKFLTLGKRLEKRRVFRKTLPWAAGQAAHCRAIVFRLASYEKHPQVLALPPSVSREHAGGSLIESVYELVVTASFTGFLSSKESFSIPILYLPK